MTDLNTMDDWKNKGFDDFFDGRKISEFMLSATSTDGQWAWVCGWMKAEDYRNAMRGQTDAETE